MTESSTVSEHVAADLQEMEVIRIENGVVTITEKVKQVLEKLNQLHELNVNYPQKIAQITQPCLPNQCLLSKAGK